MCRRLIRAVVGFVLLLCMDFNEAFCQINGVISDDPPSYEGVRPQNDRVKYGFDYFGNPTAVGEFRKLTLAANAEMELVHPCLADVVNEGRRRFIRGRYAFTTVPISVKANSSEKFQIHLVWYYDFAPLEQSLQDLFPESRVEIYHEEPDQIVVVGGFHRQEDASFVLDQVLCELAKEIARRDRVLDGLKDGSRLKLRPRVISRIVVQ